MYKTLCFLAVLLFCGFVQADVPHKTVKVDVVSSPGSQIVTFYNVNSSDTGYYYTDRVVTGEVYSMSVSGNGSLACYRLDNNGDPIIHLDLLRQLGDGTNETTYGLFYEAANGKLAFYLNGATAPLSADFTITFKSFMTPDQADHANFYCTPILSATNTPPTSGTIILAIGAIAGVTSYNYMWYKNAGTLSSGTTSTSAIVYTDTYASTADTGVYTVMVSDSQFHPAIWNSEPISISVTP